MESSKDIRVKLHCTKPFASAALPLSNTGERSQFAVFYLPPRWAWHSQSLRMQLWDSLVQPTLMYEPRCEGYQQRNDACGQLQQDFLRRLLGVHSGTPNMAVLAEVGRRWWNCEAATNGCAEEAVKWQAQQAPEDIRRFWMSAMQDSCVMLSGRQLVCIYLFDTML